MDKGKKALKSLTNPLGKIAELVEKYLDAGRPKELDDDTCNDNLTVSLLYLQEIYT